MKVRDLLDKFAMVKESKIIIRLGTSIEKYKVILHDSITFTFGKIIPDELMDKEVIVFFLGNELYPNTLFITIEETI